MTSEYPERRGCSSARGRPRRGLAGAAGDFRVLTHAAFAAIGPGGARPTGLALSLVRGPGRRARIAVVDKRGSALLRLGPFPESDVVAIWRALGAASGLPLMVEHADGRLAPYPQVGPVLVGPIRIRRRHGLLAGRRPRFLVRRKTTRLPQRPLVHREREMFAREKA